MSANDYPDPKEVLRLYREHSPDHVTRHMRAVNRLPLNERIELALYVALHLQALYSSANPGPVHSLDDAREELAKTRRN